MKERILKGWTFTRALYLLIGVLIIIQSLMENEWLGVAFGGYFSAMGLFAFGCASGSCFQGNCAVDPKEKKTSTAIRELELKESNIE